jgi:hypothetical protein
MKPKVIGVKTANESCNQMIIHAKQITLAQNYTGDHSTYFTKGQFRNSRYHTANLGGI